MTETPITHIERIEIKGLWGKYDIDWTLDPKVNILIGINGSGKTTVLNLVTEGLHPIHNHLGHFIPVFESLSIQFNNNKEINYQVEDDKKGKFIASYFNNEFSIENEILTDKIATFETEYQPLEAIQKLSNKDVKTNLDWDLWKLEKDFQGYKSKIFTRYIKTKNEELLAKSNLFESIVNQLFKATNKTILISEESEISFQDGAEIRNLYQLSSGEKQMLIILLKVLLQDNQPYILLLDEPEISMHVTWQHSLIQNIQKLNENCQLIIATHSPSLLGKVWHGKVVEMSDITHPVNELEAV